MPSLGPINESRSRIFQLPCAHACSFPSASFPPISYFPLKFLSAWSGVRYWALSLDALSNRYVYQAQARQAGRQATYPATWYYVRSVYQLKFDSIAAQNVAARDRCPLTKKTKIKSSPWLSLEFIRLESCSITASCVFSLSSGARPLTQLIYTW